MVVWGEPRSLSPNRETTMDTRKYDLEDLYKQRKYAKSAYERDMVDKSLERIMRESGAVRERREKLIMALRNDDKRAVQRFQHELMMMRAEETKGKDY